MTLPVAIIRQQKQYLCIFSLAFAHMEQWIKEMFEKDINCHDNLL